MCFCFLFSDGKNQRVEMGANWIHGIERNPIFQIADENGLLQLRYKDKGLRHRNVFLTENGEEVNQKVVKECDFTYGLLIQQCEEFYQMDMPTPYDVDSVGDYMAMEIDEKLENFPGDERKLREMIFVQHLKQETVVSGCNNLQDVSLSEFGCYEELPGVHYTIPPGFQSVLDILCIPYFPYAHLPCVHFCMLYLLYESVVLLIDQNANLTLKLNIHPSFLNEFL